jgi:Mn-dependent DtxR family transcriptional regulator
VKNVSEEVTEELKKKILDYLETVSKAKNKDVARAIGVEKALCDRAIGELGKEGKIEYLYLGTSFVKLKGKEG